ncbi:imidazolonepropionase [Undibacterium oligocarboniphilum]|uniref:Imidazolonepropionase n=1 Tax=Undibacterium oligocarboniphilum TaxID=666702 RepID=A0A850QE27_9BURK|nr:imidazolonepropionase [Undibacterium oligocarboniphilum]MBC3869167.1 imidazolonepropionase [Undibacterium oligocarboniphilum]NVO77147.1 imidazolonepropionase [Undibacterium oligocarboniphilum]
MVWDSLWTNVHLATMRRGDGGSYGEIQDGALAIRDGRIAWIGRRAELPQDYRVKQHHDGGGGWITPGLIDCHTHLVYGGNRSNEFEARLNGVSYEEIARQGGGILSTVRATRAASEEELLTAALPRLRALLAEGVTTLEIKSGYGLDLETEARILRVARRIGREFPVRVRTTFLGAHALPPEYAGRADDYIREVCEVMLPALLGEELVDAVDVFCEKIGFTPAQTERVFFAAQAAGIPVKLHAEQLSDQGGAALVARFRGLSADHLEYLSADGISAMAAHGTVAVLLPGAFYFLRETVLPPVAALRAAGVSMALATDCNPGTSPLTSLLLTMNMGCTLFRMTPLEALQGVTCHAAQALDLQQEAGTLETGQAADFVVWDITRLADLAYHIGANPARHIVFAGQPRL